MESSGETRSSLTNSRRYMENVSTTCNVRVKRCSTLMNTCAVSPVVEDKHNDSSRRTGRADLSRQVSVVNPDFPSPSMKNSCCDGQCSIAGKTKLLHACSCAESGSQNITSAKASDGLGDETSCISRVNTTNTVGGDAHRKNDGSGSSASVDSFPPCEKAVNDQEIILCNTRGNPEEPGNNIVEKLTQDVVASKADISDSPLLREFSPKGASSGLSEEKGESSSTTTSSRKLAEVSNVFGSKELKEKQCLPMEQHHNADLPIPSQHDETTTGAVIEDVRVCDICGDVGREDMLAVCTNCNDGAEHIYCMRIRMKKVPAGDWLCEECGRNRESGRERQKEEEVAKVLKRSSSMASTQDLECLGALNLKKKLRVDVGASDIKKMTITAVSSPKLPSKFSLCNSEAVPITKRKSWEIQNNSPRGVHPKKGLLQSSSPKNVAEGKVKPLPLSGSERNALSINKAHLLKTKSFNVSVSQVKDFQLQQGNEKSVILRENRKEGRGLFCRSQSFKDSQTRISGSDTPKAKKTLVSASPRVKDQIRVRKTEDQSASPPKYTPRLGSSNTKNNHIEGNEELVLKPSAAACNNAQEKRQAIESLCNSPKLRRFKTQKGSGDEHGENQRVLKNLKAGRSLKTHELDVNRSPKRAYLDNILVPSQRGVIPLIDFMWKGGFEVSRSGGLTDLFPGIQAHKSNRASDRVKDVVVKFPQKIVLDEVSQLSVWPTQFTNKQVMEKNIALFFFPESLESYEAYKCLLKHMTTNNSALRGCISGVELLIFSSEVLPLESRRWNNLAYLWGVFRMTSVKSTEKETASQNQQVSPGSSRGSSEPQAAVTKEIVTGKEMTSQNQQSPPKPLRPRLPVTEEKPIVNELASQNQQCSPGPSRGSREPQLPVTEEMPTEKTLTSQDHQCSLESSPGSLEPHPPVFEVKPIAEQRKMGTFPFNENCSALETSSVLPLASPSRICDAPDPVASKVKVLHVPTNNHQISILDSSRIPAPDDERNKCRRPRDFDLNIWCDNNSRDPASSSSFYEVVPDKKMKGIIIESPEPYGSQEFIQFFESSPLSYAGDHASSSGTASIRTFASDKELQFSYEDVDLELSLGLVDKPGKRKLSSFSMSLEDDDDDRKYRAKRPMSSLALSLSLAPPS